MRGRDPARHVHDEVQDKLDLRFEDLGEQPVKNIARPVRVYRVCSEAAALGDRAASAPSAPPTPPDAPSIVVLAFHNMSADPEQGYFADGIAEDIITDLSKISDLLVIARNSAFSYKGRAVDLRQVCRELGVRYALEGSVRKAGSRVRITAQLIDGTSGGHLWADRYDRELTDIFEVQDEVTRKIVAALKVKLTPEERERVAGRGTDNVEAYDWCLRGRELVWRHTRDGVALARPLLERAIALDPDFVLPHAYLSLGHVQDYVNRWSADPERSLDLAREFADRAVSLDESEPQAHFALAVVHIWQRQLDQSIADARRAIALDPNFADAYGTLGNALHYAGRSAESLEQYAHMARLNPHFPPIFLFFMAQDYFALARYEEAAQLLERRLARQPDSDVSQVLLAACYGCLGRPEEARAAWQEALRLNPGYSLEHRRKILPYQDPATFEQVVGGLRKAGISV
jgi:adenylate cyclase